MKVLFVTSEATPYIKSGGLADVLGSLPKELVKNNNFDISLSITIPLSKPKEENRINRLIRRIRKNKI